MLKHIGTLLATEKNLDKEIKELKGIGYTTKVKSLGKIENLEKLEEIVKPYGPRRSLTLEDVEKIKGIEFYEIDFYKDEDDLF